MKSCAFVSQLKRTGDPNLFLVVSLLCDRICTAVGRAEGQRGRCLFCLSLSLSRKKQGNALPQSQRATQEQENTFSVSMTLSRENRKSFRTKSEQHFSAAIFRKMLHLGKSLREKAPLLRSHFAENQKDLSAKHKRPECLQAARDVELNDDASR